MISHASALAKLRGTQPRATRKARRRRKGELGAHDRYVNPAYGDREVTIALRLESEANGSHEHWKAVHNRVQRIRGAVAAALRLARGKPSLPCVVLITRIAPRALDAHDNLPRSCKVVVDSVAAWLGIDDADPRVVWRYAQERGAPRTYGVRVQWSDWGEFAAALKSRALDGVSE